MIDANDDLTAVGLKLRFPGPTGADAAAELGHGATTAGETWQLVLQLGEFYLQLTFTGPSVPSEDVENELGTVNHVAGQPSLDVAEL